MNEIELNEIKLNEQESKPSVSDSGKIKNGDLDCEKTAGNVEALFTLLFFVSFVIYLGYMFALIP